jgi:hypothetical protein
MKELLKAKEKVFIEQHKAAVIEISKLQQLAKKLEGAIEAVQMLIKEIDEKDKEHEV